MICSKCKEPMIPSIEYDVNGSWSPLWKCTSMKCANHEFASVLDVNLWALWKNKWNESGVSSLTVLADGENSSQTLIFEDVENAENGTQHDA